MKSYYKFLESTQAVGAAVSAARKPVFRSSAIFPVMHNASFTSRIAFMGYWLLKREIREVTLLYTLRDRGGVILTRNSVVIDAPRAFSLELYPLLRDAGTATADFTGSIELEIFSTRNLVFPYPAFVLCYYNDRFSTAVHTAGRIYNDVEDLRENEETRVAESGFDVYPDPRMRPFVAFTNGPLRDPDPKFSCAVISRGGKESKGEFRLPPLEPFETVFLSLRDHVDLSVLGAEPGTVKLSHAFKGFFPRLISGNFQDTPEPCVSITHTYYDCSTLCGDADYWTKADVRLHHSAILVPLFLEEAAYTDLVFYPIYSPAHLLLSVGLYDGDGKRLGVVEGFRRYDTAKTVHERVAFLDVCRTAGVDPRAVRGANLMFNAEAGSRFPTRLKMGLNVGVKGGVQALPCNICFAPKVGDVHAASKPRTFRWAPFVNVGRSLVVVTNAAPLKEYRDEAVVLARFFHEADDAVLERTLRVPAFGQARIDSKSDLELTAFFGERTGWMTFESSNPYVNGWYFDFHKEGAVAGDHCF